LTEDRINSVDKENRTVEPIMSQPDRPPDKVRYNAWVSQSINQTAEHSYKRMLLENRLAADFNASYLCKTPFEFELLLAQFHPIN
jgi:hypothetical protein